jgi:hypothetical protein
MLNRRGSVTPGGVRWSKRPVEHKADGEQDETSRDLKTGDGEGICRQCIDKESNPKHGGEEADDSADKAPDVHSSSLPPTASASFHARTTGCRSPHQERSRRIDMMRGLKDGGLTRRAAP